MRCVVTAGPTYEAMDEVRRLTNFSTGALGTELANFLTECGHEVILLIGEQATYCGERKARRVVRFSTTEDLKKQLRELSSEEIGSVFHAAAVSDFRFGKIWSRNASGELTEVKSGKISTRKGTLMAELVPTPKIIGELRGWYPKALLVGWKFEVEGDRKAALAAAGRQMKECKTDGCVVNGKAYGEGFGLLGVDGKAAHFRGKPRLFEGLARLTR